MEFYKIRSSLDDFYNKCLNSFVQQSEDLAEQNKQDIDTLFYNSDVTRNIMKIIKEQLLIDKEKMKKGEDITCCSVFAPRIQSSLDKKIGIAKKTALEMFPGEGSNESKFPISYIKYSKLIAELTAYYKLQEKKKYDEKISFKQARLNEHKGLWCELKNRPVSKAVAKPEAMPVNISEYTELSDFFNFLSSNETIRGDIVDKNGAYMKFNRGAVYTDGRMDLCKQVVGPTWADNLLASLKDNDKIKHFLLGNNIINTTGANSIATFLINPHKSKIETWYLAGNEIDKDGIKIICNALKNDPDMKYLWLKRNPLQPEGIKHIGDLLKINQNIKILDLQNTAIFNEGMYYLVEGLKENKSLRHLYIDANGLTTEGIKPLCEYFINRKEKGITSLWVSMNRLDDEGVCMLFESLKNYKYLKRLNVGSNRISDKSAQVLYETLTHHPKLQALDIGLYKATADMGELSNRISDKGASYISKFIRENKIVKLIAIIHNDITNDGLEEITRAILENDTVLYLIYAQYGLNIDRILVEKIDEKLEHNRKTIEDPNKKNARFIKHSKKILLIDSIYRNKM